MSISWQLDVEPPPKLLVLPPAADSLDEAHAAIELWEHYSGKRLDPAQRLTVEVMMATAGGRWAAATTGREMPRQNGKGDELEVVELWGLVQRGEAILHTVHDAVLLASQAQQRMLGVLEGHADLRRLVKRKWQGTGQQMIEMSNGGTVWYRTRTGGGGRGVDDVDRLVVDEAQHATEEQLAAVAPTLLANKNPQMNAVGTAAIDGRSAWWWSVRKRALSPDPGGFGYVGHTAETVRLDDRGRVIQEPVDVNDRSAWAAANPSVAAGRGGGMDFLEEQLRRLGPASFAREHLGVWDPERSEAGSDLDLDLWSSLAGTEDARPSRIALSVEVTPDRAWSMIALAGERSDGAIHVQIVESKRGTAWVAERVRDLDASWDVAAMAVDPAGPAGSLLHDLGGLNVVQVTGREYGVACAAFFDALAESKLRHQNQPLLNIAVEVAVMQPRAGTWVWGSSKPGTDVSPLKAVTLALHALREAPTKKARTGVVWL